MFATCPAATPGFPFHPNLWKTMLSILKVKTPQSFLSSPLKRGLVCKQNNSTVLGFLCPWLEVKKSPNIRMRKEECTERGNKMSNGGKKMN